MRNALSMNKHMYMHVNLWVMATLKIHKLIWFDNKWWWFQISQFSVFVVAGTTKGCNRVASVWWNRTASPPYRPVWWWVTTTKGNKGIPPTPPPLPRGSRHTGGGSASSWTACPFAPYTTVGVPSSKPCLSVCCTMYNGLMLSTQTR